MKRAVYRAVHAWRPPHIVESRCSGIRLRCSSQSRISEDIFANAFEHKERILLDRILVPGLTVLDIGANLGFYTCLFARKVGPAGRVIAFEPTPATFSLLEQNVRINGLDEIVEVRQCALSDAEGTASMNVFPAGSDVYNSLGVDYSLGHERPVGVIEVPTTSLENCLRGETFPNGCFIKIDVEGFEYQVIKGGAESLRHLDNASMVVEMYEPAARQCGSSTLDTLALLESCGFAAYWMTPRSLAPLDSHARADLKNGTLPPDVFFFKPQSRPPWLA